MAAMQVPFPIRVDVLRASLANLRQNLPTAHARTAQLDSKQSFSLLPAVCMTQQGSRQGSPARSRQRSPAPSRRRSPAPSRHCSPAPSRHRSPAPSRRLSPARNQARSRAHNRRVSRLVSPPLLLGSRHRNPARSRQGSPARIRLGPSRHLCSCRCSRRSKA
jgi:hypothetical protein